MYPAATLHTNLITIEWAFQADCIPFVFYLYCVHDGSIIVRIPRRYYLFMRSVDFGV